MAIFSVRRSPGLLLMFWLAVVSSNLVHELGGEEERGLLVEPENKEAIAEEEIAQLSNQVTGNLPNLEHYKKVVSESKSTRPWGKEAKAMVEAVQKLHQELTDRNAQLEIDAKKPLKRGGANTQRYGKVSGMRILENSADVKNVPNADACELKCSLNRKCMSFSFNAEKELCSLSTTAMGYSPDSAFYAKSMTAGGIAWAMYPGLALTSQSTTTMKGKTKANCQIDCGDRGAQCAGYSYSEKTGTCGMTSEPLHYDKEWDYYEKPPRAHKLGHPFDVKSEDENDLLGRLMNKFWVELQHYRHVTDKKKLQRLEDRITDARQQAHADADELRATSSVLVELATRAEQLNRASVLAAHASRSENDALLAAQGNQEQLEMKVQVLQRSINKRKAEIQKSMPPPPADGEEGQSETTDTLEDLIAEDTKLTMYNEELVMAQKDLQKAFKGVQDAKISLELAQEHVAQLDNKRIAVLQKRHKEQEYAENLKNSLKHQAAEALDLQKVVDREEELLEPPSSALAPPSLHSQLSWDVKADEAEAYAAAEKMERMMNEGQPKI